MVIGIIRGHWYEFFDFSIFTFEFTPAIAFEFLLLIFEFNGC